MQLITGLGVCFTFSSSFTQVTMAKNVLAVAGQCLINVFDAEGTE